MPGVVDCDTLAVVLAGTLMVWLPPPLTLYVIVTGKLCGFVNVTLGGAAPSQTTVEPLTVAVGIGRTLIVVVLFEDNDVVQLEELLTEVIVRVVDPALANADVVKEPVPPEKFIAAVSPVAAFGAERL